MSGGRIEENKIRDTIIQGAIIGLKRNQALGKCPEIYKMTPTNNLSNKGEATLNALP